MAQLLNVSFRKIGGLRFIRLGRINIQLSVSSKYAPPKPKARPLIEAEGQYYRPVVKLYRDGKPYHTSYANVVYATAGEAMAHARAGIAACNFKIAR